MSPRKPAKLPNQTEKPAKLSRKIEQMLDYSEEFEALIAQQLLELSAIQIDGVAKNDGDKAKKSENVILCASVDEKSIVEAMENIFETTFYAKPWLVIVDPSFDFRSVHTQDDLLY